MKLQASLGDPCAVVLGTRTDDGKANFVAAFSPQVVGMGQNAGKLAGEAHPWGLSLSFVGPAKR